MLPRPSPSLVGNLRPGELTPHGDWCHGLVSPRPHIRLSRNYTVWLACSAVDVSGQAAYVRLGPVDQAASRAVRPGGRLWSTVPVGDVNSNSLLALPVMVHRPSWT